jgi:diguanylate cyclase (GGDEF)-like protein
MSPGRIVLLDPSTSPDLDRIAGEAAAVVVTIPNGDAGDVALLDVATLRHAAAATAIIAVVCRGAGDLDLRLLRAGADEIVDGGAPSDGVLEQAVARAITRRRDRVDAEERLALRAATDELTGLARRQGLVEAIAAEQARAHRITTPAGRPAVLMLDLDGLKGVNDALGHGAGDAVLVEAARRIGARLRVSDLAARLGGDEFGVLLRTGSDPVTAARDLVAGLAFRHGSRLVSASVGIASLADAPTPAQCLELADAAMYHAKRAGGNRYAIHPASLVHAHVR